VNHLFVRKWQANFSAQQFYKQILFSFDLIAPLVSPLFLPLSSPLFSCFISFSARGGMIFSPSSSFGIHYCIASWSTSRV